MLPASCARPADTRPASTSSGPTRSAPCRPVTPADTSSSAPTTRASPAKVRTRGLSGAMCWPGVRACEVSGVLLCGAAPGCSRRAVVVCGRPLRAALRCGCVTRLRARVTLPRPSCALHPDGGGRTAACCQAPSPARRRAPPGIMVPYQRSQSLQSRRPRLAAPSHNAGVLTDEPSRVYVNCMRPGLVWCRCWVDKDLKINSRYSGRKMTSAVDAP